MKTSTLRAAVLMAGLATTPAFSAVPGILGLSSSTASVTEGTANVTLSVTRTGGSTGAVSVPYSFSDGTASSVSASDYTAVAGTLNWADGETATKSIVVPITNNSISETSETFTVNLGAPIGGATLGTSSATVTILDDDAAILTFLNDSGVTAEESAGTVALQVERRGSLTGAVSVSYSTLALSGVAAGDDYTAVTGTLSWASSDGASKTINLPIIDDSEVEVVGQVVGVTLSSPVGAVISDSQDFVNITENDSTFTFPPTTFSGSESSESASVTVLRYGDTRRAGSVQISASSGSATSGVDFAAVSGQTVSFAAGETSKLVNLTILQDTSDDEAELFSISLSNAAQTGAGTATVATPVASVTSGLSSTTVEIADDDGALSIGTTETAATPVFGSTITLSATFTGATSLTSEGFTYAWTRGTTTIISGGRYQISTSNPTANTSKVTLTITDANATDNGAYTLTLTNGLGESQTFSTNVTVTQAETTRDPNTTALTIANASHSVTSFLPLPDGRALLAVKGTISGASGSSAIFSANGVAVLAIDGTVSAASAGNFNGTIHAMRRLSDGKILVAGEFTSIGGLAVNGRSRLARLNADFSLDTTFLPSPASSILTGRISLLELDDQGRIYLAGNFTDYAGDTSQDLLVRLYPDGLLDTTFTAAPSATLNASVNALAKQDDGKIVVAGSFTQLAADGLAVSSLYRLAADGTLDLDFNPQVANTASQFSHAVLDTEQRIVLAQTNPSRTIYRLLSTGVKDLNFSGPVSYNNTINAVVALPDDRLLVGGLFTSVTVGTTSTLAPRLLRLSENGSLDTSYTVGSSLTAATAQGVDKVGLAANGRVYLAGGFTAYAGSTANRVLVLEGDAPVLAFTVQPQGSAQNAGGSATFRAAATGQNGFTFAWFKDGEPLANDERISGAAADTLTISNLVPSDSADYTVSVTLPASPAPVSITSSPAPLAVISTPEIITAPVDTTANIYGSPTLSVLARGGIPLSYKWFFEGEEIIGANSATLEVAGADFDDAGRYSVQVSNAYGSVSSDSIFLTIERNPGAIAEDVPSLSANADVHAILKLQDGSILVGGSFTSLTVDEVVYPRAYLARFLSNGALDTGFAPTFSAAVRALAQDSAGRIFVGGDFASVTFGTTTTNYRRVLRLTSSLTLDTTFNGTLNISQAASVNALAPVGDGSVSVGGNFTAFAGVTSPSTARLVRLTATGAVDIGFVSGATGTVNTLAYYNGAIFAGGESNTWGETVGSARLVKLSSNGTRLSFPTPDTTVTVNELLIADGYGLVVGGRSGSSGAPTAYLRRFDPDTGAITSMESGLTSNTDVGALARQSDGSLLVGASGVLKRLNALAEPVDSSFGDGDTPPFGGSRLYALAVDNDGRIWAGGTFSAYDGTPSSRLVVLAGGTTDSSSGARSPQTVEVAQIAGRVYSPSGSTENLSASATSGLTNFIYSAEGPASVVGNVLTITGAGTIKVTALQPGNSTFAPASASRTFTVTKATQSITFPLVAQQRVSSPPFVLGATTTATDLTVRYVVTRKGEGEPLAVLGEDGKTLTLTGEAGTIVVTAYQDGDARYRAADPVQREIVVADVDRLSQAITFNQPAARVFGSAPAPVVVSTNARGLTVTLEVIDGPGELAEDNRTLTVTAAGTVTIRATQAGSADYLPAAPIVRELVVSKARQTITFTLPTTLTLGNPAPVLSATASSGLPVSFALGTGNTAATLTDGVLTITGAGRVVVVASQVGNEDYLAASSVTRSMVVTTPKLVLGALAHTYDGEPHAVTVSGAPVGYDDDVVVTYQLGSGTPTTEVPTDAGTYRVTAALGTSKTTGLLKIAKKVLTVTPRNKTILVGTTIPTGEAARAFFPVDYSGFVDGEDVDDIATQPIPFATANASSNAGSNYKIKVRGGLDENYAFAYLDGTLTLVGLEGNYAALLVDEGGVPIGHLNLTMLRNSFGYTGSLSLAAESAAVVIRSGSPSLTVNPVLTGEFVDDAVSASGAWTRSATTSLPALIVNLDVDSDGALSGSVVRGGATLGVFAQGNRLRSAPTGAAGVGTYTLTLAPPAEASTDAPQGVGSARVSISASGMMTVSGVLADGTLLSASSRVDLENGYRVFAKPYGTARSGNRFGSYFQLEPNSVGCYRVEECDFAWSKPALSTDASYRSGIDLVLVGNLEQWRAPATTPTVITLAQRLGLTSSAGASGTFLIDFLCAGLTDDMLDTLPTDRVLLPTGKLASVAVAENPSSFTSAFVTSNGGFSGSFRLVIPPATTARTILIRGTLRQPLAEDANPNVVGRGYFLLPGASSSDPVTSGEIRFEVPAPLL